jgi:hypothetical membrane protein
MIVAFAFAVIGALLVLANSKHLRKNSIFILAIILTVSMALIGVYFIMTVPKKTDSTLFFPLFSPLMTLVLWWIARLMYRANTKKEIIMHLHGLIPVKHEERYVTQQEKYITFILLVLSAIIPYLVLMVFK